MPIIPINLRFTINKLMCSIDKLFHSDWFYLGLILLGYFYADKSIWFYFWFAKKTIFSLHKTKNFLVHRFQNNPNLATLQLDGRSRFDKLVRFKEGRLKQLIFRDIWYIRFGFIGDYSFLFWFVVFLFCLICNDGGNLKNKIYWRKLIVKLSIVLFGFLLDE